VQCIPDVIGTAVVVVVWLQLRDLPVKPAPQLPYESREEAVQKVATGLARVSQDTKAKAYVSHSLWPATP
jgi:hypothetical protein